MRENKCIKVSEKLNLPTVVRTLSTVQQPKLLKKNEVFRRNFNFCIICYHLRFEINFQFHFQFQFNELIVFSAYENCVNPSIGPVPGSSCIPQGVNCTVGSDINLTCDAGFFCCNVPELGIQLPVACNIPPMQCLPYSKCSVISDLFVCGPGSICCEVPAIV